MKTLHLRNIDVCAFNVVYFFTTVRPLTKWPVIDKCGEENRICFYSFHQGDTIMCSVEYSRPVTHVSWRNGSNHDVKSQIKSIIDSNMTFSSYAKVKGDILTVKTMSLLVCTAEAPLGLLRFDESVLLMQSSSFKPDILKSTLHLVEEGSTATIVCDKSTISYLTWTRFHANIVETVAWAVFMKDNVHYVKPGDIELGVHGSLKIGNVQIMQEGIYTCAFNDGAFDNVNVYNISVYGE